MVQYLKQGRTEEQSASDAQAVQNTVRKILADIEIGGDAALRDYSSKFDKWAPSSFRLSQSEIEACLKQLSSGQIDDIRFAQQQIRNFAQLQKDALRDIEVETLPGVVLGHRNLPVESVACYVPGGKFPLIASAHMRVVTAKVAGVPRVAASSPAKIAALRALKSVPFILLSGGLMTTCAFSNSN